MRTAKPIPEMTPKDIERFWKKVDKESNKECWLWIGSKDINGYGRFMKDYNPILAHRISFHLFYKKEIEGLFVLHHCDRPNCVNPAHLFLGTQKDNMQDAFNKGRMNLDGLKLGKLVRGENRKQAKLTNKKVVEIRELYANRKITYLEIAKMYDISLTNVCFIVTRQRWTHVE